MSKADSPLTLLLVNVANHGVVRELQIPAKVEAELAELKPVTLFMTADGSYVGASANLRGGKGIVVVWKTEARDPIRTIDIEKRPAELTALALTPDGSHVAVGHADGRIVVYPLPGGKGVELPGASRTRIHSLAFRNERPGGLCGPHAGDAGGSVIIWDLDNRVPRSFCHGSPHGVHAVAFSPDMMILASGGRGSLKLWDVATGRLLLNISGYDWTTGIAFSHDGKRLAVSGMRWYGEGGVTIWKLDHSRGIQTLYGLVGQVRKVHFSRDGQLLAALSDDWQLAIWNLKNSRLLHVFDTPRGKYADNAALLFMEGKRFAFCAGRQAKLWDLDAGKELGSWELPIGFVDHLAYHATENKLLLFRVETKETNVPPYDTNFENYPRICRIRELGEKGEIRRIKEIEDFNHKVYAAIAAPDASVFVVDGDRGPEGKGRTIKAFDCLTGQEKWSLASTRKRDHALLTLDPTGKRLVMLPDDSSDATLIEMGSTKDFRGAGKFVRSLHSAPLCLDSKDRYWGTFASKPPPGFELYSMDSQFPVVTLGIDNPPSSIVPEFNRSGTHVAWGNADGTVSLCDIQKVRERLGKVGLDW